MKLRVLSALLAAFLLCTLIAGCATNDNDSDNDSGNTYTFTKEYALVDEPAGDAPAYNGSMYTKLSATISTGLI